MIDLYPPPPGTAPTHPLGQQVQEFLGRLRTHGLTIGPREALDVHRLCLELVARGSIRELRDLIPYLSPVLCKSARERTLFMGVADQTASPGALSDHHVRASVPPRAKRRSRALLQSVWQACLFILTLSALAGLYFFVGQWLDFEVTAPAWLGAFIGAAPFAFIAIWLATRATVTGFRRQSASVMLGYNLSLDGVWSSLSLHRQTGEWRDRESRSASGLSSRQQDQAAQEINVDETISATVFSGQRGVAIRYRQQSVEPSCTVLIETESTNDLEADRIRLMVDLFSLDHRVAMDCYGFNVEPSFVTDFRTETMISIEELARNHAHGHLLVFTSGNGLVNSTTQSSTRSASILRNWRGKAILTATPIQQWGTLQMRLARDIGAYVGRSTHEGFIEALAAIGLRGSDHQRLEIDELQGAGDGAIRPLPARLLLNTYRLVHGEPSPDYRAEEIIDDLRNALDKRGLAWLAALSVYPKLEFPMMIYLGLELGYFSNTIAGDRRLASLTRLPWLRQGHMPIWLRARLVATLSADERSAIIAQLTHLLLGASIKSKSPIRSWASRVSEAYHFPGSNLPSINAGNGASPLEALEPTGSDLSLMLHLKARRLSDRAKTLVMDRTVWAMLAIATCTGIAAAALAPSAGETVGADRFLLILYCYLFGLTAGSLLMRRRYL